MVEVRMEELDLRNPRVFSFGGQPQKAFVLVELQRVEFILRFRNRLWSYQVSFIEVWPKFYRFDVLFLPHLHRVNAFAFLKLVNLVKLLPALSLNCPTLYRNCWLCQSIELKSPLVVLTLTRINLIQWNLLKLSVWSYPVDVNSVWDELPMSCVAFRIAMTVPVLGADSFPVALAIIGAESHCLQVVTDPIFFDCAILFPMLIKIENRLIRRDIIVL